MSTLSEQIGQRLRVARKATNYKSAREFSSKHHIPETTYAQHESGKRSLNVDALMRYIHILDINPRWLLTGEGDPYLVSKTALQKDKLSQEMKKVTECKKLLTSQLSSIENLVNKIDIEALGKLSSATDENLQIAKETFIEIWKSIIRLIDRLHFDENLTSKD